MTRWIALFVLFLIVFEAIVWIWWRVGAERRRRQLIDSLASKVNPEGVVRTTVLIERPTRTNQLREMFRPHTPGGVVLTQRLGKTSFRLLTLAMVCLGFWLGTKFIGMLGIFAPVIGAIIGGLMPRIYRSRVRDKRMAAIEEQFPDALDFLGRSVRAGNAFSIALELLAEEAHEPLQSEIRKLTREMALGAGLEDALFGLVARLPLLEVRMFVAAVMLQRETGGNLSEVLSKLSSSVRERLRLRGHVRAVSGQGRLTAQVLTFLPIATILLLKLVSPTYINAMTEDPLGRNLLGVAVISQMIGYFIMRKIIRIEV